MSAERSERPPHFATMNQLIDFVTGKRELTLEEYLDVAKDSLYFFGDPGDSQTDFAKKEIRRVAHGWLITSSIDQRSLMGHPDEKVQTFGRRMYIELNPYQHTEQELSELKEEWGIE